MSVAKQILFTENFKMLPGNVPGAAVGNGTVIDRRSFNTAKLLVAAATITSGTLDVKIQTGDMANGSDMADYELRGSGFDADQLTDSNTNTTLDIDLSGAKRYIRAVSESTGTVSAFDLAFILGDGEYSDNFFEGE